MPVEPIDDLDDPRVADYRHVPDPELLRRGAIFVAEGRLVVRTLLTGSPFATRSVLVTETAFEALRDVLEPRLAELPVYLVSPATIQRLTGFNIHRGCLAIGERPARVMVDTLWNSALAGFDVRLKPDATGASLVVLEHIVDADNVGSIFRNAAAFGARAVVLGPSCCDPLYRKAIRTSMGAALRVPFVHAGEWPRALQRLREAGYAVMALAPRADAISIDRFVESDRPRKVAVLAGSEGPGLSAEALAAADVAVRIPIDPAVDSLNVATAVAIALHRLTTPPAR